MSASMAGREDEGRPWLRGRNSVSLLECRWFHPPGLHVEVSLSKILNPKLLTDVLVGTLHGSHRHQCMNVCMNHCESFLDKSVC